MPHEPTCHNGHPMRLLRFRLDYEQDDPVRDSDLLRLFEAMGAELGAEVVVLRCDRCREVRADFRYDEG